MFVLFLADLSGELVDDRFDIVYRVERKIGMLDDIIIINLGEFGHVKFHVIVGIGVEYEFQLMVSDSLTINRQLT